MIVMVKMRIRMIGVKMKSPNEEQMIMTMMVITFLVVVKSNKIMDAVFLMETLTKKMVISE